MKSAFLVLLLATTVFMSGCWSGNPIQVAVKKSEGSEISHPITTDVASQIRIATATYEGDADVFVDYSDCQQTVAAHESCDLKISFSAAPNDFSGQINMTYCDGENGFCGPNKSFSIGFEVKVQFDRATDHLVFNSNTGHNGNMGGLAGADAACQLQADDPANNVLGDELRGKYVWRALLSSSQVNAKDRLNFSGRIFNLNPEGFEKVADSGADFWDGSDLDAAIRYRLDGLTAGPNTYTGTDAFGYHTGDSCADWTSTSTTLNGTNGHAYGQESPYWVNRQKVPCNWGGLALYCVSQELKSQ